MKQNILYIMSSKKEKLLNIQEKLDEVTQLLNYTYEKRDAETQRKIHDLLALVREASDYVQVLTEKTDDKKVDTVIHLLASIVLILNDLIANTAPSPPQFYVVPQFCASSLFQ